MGKKEKAVVAKVDLQYMFREEPEYETVSAAEIQADLEADKQRAEWAKAFAEMKKAQSELKAEPAAASSKQVTKPAAKAKASTKESQWGEVEKGGNQSEIAGPSLSEAKKVTAEEKFKLIEEKLAAKRLEAESKECKVQKDTPQPKKKTKGAKMSLLDFYDEDIVARKE